MQEQSQNHGSVVIVSHGQPSEPEVGEAEIREFAASVAAEMPGHDVRGATLASPGALESAVSGANGPVAIYPFFMADGWFTQKVLPTRLQNMDVQHLPPFGLEPDLPDFTAYWLRGELAAKGWKAEETALFVAGHGSGKSRRPSEVTNGFAYKLGKALPFRSIECGFVEEPPFLAESAQGLGEQAICLPFFAFRRGHVLDDLPEALQAARFEGLRLEPFGCHPGLPRFLARRLASA